jgi:tRNA(Arg) A34 adenosine deaminase TadA
MPTLSQEWEGASPAWKAAFSQAWRAFANGAIPVGAAVVDPQGTLAAAGPNRIYDHASGDDAGQLTGTWLAHAEINAIAQLDPHRSTSSEGWSIYSTLEPCPLCLGAITVAFRGSIHVAYGVADPIGGAMAARESTNLGRRRLWHVDSLAGPLASFAELLVAVHATRDAPHSRTARLFLSSSWRNVIGSLSPMLTNPADKGQPLECVIEPISRALAAFTPPSALSQTGF